MEPCPYEREYEYAGKEGTIAWRALTLPEPYKRQPNEFLLSPDYPRSEVIAWILEHEFRGAYQFHHRGSRDEAGFFMKDCSCGFIIRFDEDDDAVEFALRWGDFLKDETGR